MSKRPGKRRQPGQPKMLDSASVLRFFNEKSRRPLSFREIVRMMGLSSPESRALKRTLHDLVDDGRIVHTRKGLYGPSEKMDLITGYFESHRDGYGFVVPDAPGERDIFIPPRETMFAMDADRVVVRMENSIKRSGRIVRILERSHSRIAGTVEVMGSACFVRPRNKSIPYVIHVPAVSGLKAGMSVVAEVETYPTGTSPATGKIITVIKDPEDPRSEIEAIIDQFGLPRRFPKQVSEDARLAHEKKREKRRDLTELLTVTIDGEQAKDFDDAISIEEDGAGYRLWVHIADVGHYVPWGSPSDLEARRRGTSVYFPDRVIPMLPKALSEDLCSLRPDEERTAFTVEMRIGSKGEPLGAEFYPSHIKSNRRMTYTTVAKIVVDQDEPERVAHNELTPMFDLMSELAGAMRRRRLMRGSLDFDLPEPEVMLDLQGRPEAIIRSERNFAHMIIEEFMIAANEAVAEHLTKIGAPCLYRIHEPPDPEKVDSVVRTVRLLMGQGGYAGKKPKGGYVGLLEEVRGKPGQEEITYMVLRSMKQARYSEQNVGHYGLASECYLHFTSPIRRYPDLVVHRILRESLEAGGRLPESRVAALNSMLPDIAFQSSRMERLSVEAEREVIAAMRVWFMRDKLGEEYEARVIGVSTYGIRLRLNEFYVEGFISVSALTDDYYAYDERAASLRGRHKGRIFRFGMPITVVVERTDMVERQVVFGLVQPR